MNDSDTATLLEAKDREIERLRAEIARLTAERDHYWPDAPREGCL